MSIGIRGGEFARLRELRTLGVQVATSVLLGHGNPCGDETKSRAPKKAHCLSESDATGKSTQSKSAAETGQDIGPADEHFSHRRRR